MKCGNVNNKIKKNRKKFVLFFIIWVCILAIGFVIKSFQNDTFYTIEIGELIVNNGIDMMDHFSFHNNLAYTYPHWLYDVFIYLVYDGFGYTGLYISSIALLMILLILVFKVNRKITNNYSVAAFATFICTLTLGAFATARAQLVSFLVFALQIYFIEMFLKNGKKKYLGGLLLLSLILCNIHVAVWPFYFILYLPYLAEYSIAFIASKIKINDNNKIVFFLKKRFVLERNSNIKYLFITMIASLLTGLVTPIGDTPYTYLIKTMMGNSQKYIQEHQMLGWINSPFTIIIAGETLFLSIFSKVKLRDFFMICGLVFMSIISIRHLSLLSLIGTICFCRSFAIFLDNIGFDVDDKIINFFCRRNVAIISFVVVIVFSSLMLGHQLKKDFIDSKEYPTKALEYIKENINIDEMKIFNEYNFGSYLLHNDIPVFVDSRADLYTKQFSGFDYDILDDYFYSPNKYRDVFEFYGITHVLIYKRSELLYIRLNNDVNYKLLYEDDYFVLYEKLGKSNVIVTYD